ncbi:MAG TPA: hypothetical protein DCR94_04005 [Firmicutes bacterium]|nr:hypothetical protein [Bacillota bacterium]
MVGRAEESRSGLLLRARGKRREGLQKARIPIAVNDRDLGPRRPAIQEEESRKGKPLSEKVVMRIMREERLTVYRPKPKKYSSYMGESPRRRKT